MSKEIKWKKMTRGKMNCLTELEYLASHTKKKKKTDEIGTLPITQIQKKQINKPETQSLLLGV